jgi:hypothetical protein
MEREYQQKRILKDGTVKFYTYKKKTKGCPKRGAQLTIKGLILRKLKSASEEQAKNILEFINSLNIVVDENPANLNDEPIYQGVDFGNL